MARARRVKMDVRYDEADVLAAQAMATALGIKPAVVMRAAAKIGLGSGGIAAALRAESTAGDGGAGGARTTGGGEVFARRVLSDGEGSMPGAAAAPPGRAPSGPSSRPVPAARPQQVKLAVVVARRLEGGAYSSGAIPPTIGARAVRMIAAGRVLVGGVECKDPNRLVNPVEVTAAPRAASS